MAGQNGFFRPVDLGEAGLSQEWVATSSPLHTSLLESGLPTRNIEQLLQHAQPFEDLYTPEVLQNFQAQQARQFGAWSGNEDTGDILAKLARATSSTADDAAYGTLRSGSVGQGWTQEGQQLWQDSQVSDEGFLGLPKDLVTIAALAAAAYGGYSLLGAGAAGGGAMGAGALGSGITPGAMGLGFQAAVNPLMSLAELASGGLGAGLTGGVGAGMTLGSGLLSSGAAFAPETLFKSLGINFSDYGLDALSSISSGTDLMSTGGSGGRGGASSGSGLRLPAASSSNLTTMGGGSGISFPSSGASFGVSGGSAGGAEGGLLEEWMKKLGLKMPGGGALSNGLGVLSFLRGRQGDKQLQQIAQRSMEPPATKVIDPMGMGPRAPFLERLNSAYIDPSQISNMPGFQVGIDAITRKAAAAGYLGSGNMKTQLMDYGQKFWGDEVSRLASLAGAGFSPSVSSANPNAAISALSAGNDVASKALATLGFLARGMEARA